MNRKGGGGVEGESMRDLRKSIRLFINFCI